MLSLNLFVIFLRNIVFASFLFTSLTRAVVAGDYIANEKSAKEVGEAFLVSIYGEGVLKQRPFKIMSTSETWLLEGSFYCPKGHI